jgi:hypothetical protein
MRIAVLSARRKPRALSNPAEQKLWLTPKPAWLLIESMVEETCAGGVGADYSPVILLRRW